MKPKNGLNTSVDSQTCSDEMPSKQETFSYVEKIFSLTFETVLIEVSIVETNILVLFTFSFFL